MCNNDLVLSIKNASGKHVNLLNESKMTPSISTFKTSLSSSLNSITATTTAQKRKYHCDEPGCNKGFTTSGHLARHNRIHTGEKNFYCLYYGCSSRFSRQDNMMQHYRTHLSQKERRQQQQKKKNLQKNTLYDQKNEVRPITRSHRSITMPSLPYPKFDICVRSKRALSTSSVDSSTSSVIPSPYTSPQLNYILPPPAFNLQSSHSYLQNSNLYHYQVVSDRQYFLKTSKWESESSEESLPSLKDLANTVSTFG